MISIHPQESIHYHKGKLHSALSHKEASDRDLEGCYSLCYIVHRGVWWFPHPLQCQGGLLCMRMWYIYACLHVGCACTYVWEDVESNASSSDNAVCLSCSPLYLFNHRVLC